MNRFGIVLVASSIVILAVGCASTGAPEKDIPYPDPVSPEWVSNPYVEGGMASTECVEANAPMSIIKGQAASLARATLTSELKASLEDLKVNYQNRTQTTEDSGFSQNYDRVTRDLATQTLVGSRTARADYVTIADQKQYCVMVVIDEKHATVMRDKLFAQAKMDVSPDDEAQLWEAFLRKSTMESLEAERAKQN